MPEFLSRCKYCRTIYDGPEAYERAALCEESAGPGPHFAYDIGQRVYYYDPAGGIYLVEIFNRQIRLHARRVHRSWYGINIIEELNPDHDSARHYVYGREKWVCDGDLSRNLTG
jgi:hypothetical protein